MEKKLIEKYKGHAYLYAQYPNQGAWSEKIGEADLKDALTNLKEYKPKAPSLLYVNIPFCPKICHYCSCFRIKNQDYANVEKYLQSLYAEIDLFKKIYEKHSINPNIEEIHLGGGSPTYLKNRDFDSLVSHLEGIIDFKKVREFVIEIDPRQANQKRMRYFSSKGINRVSFGVQDFDLNVQKAVGRVQPPELTERLLETRNLFDSVNFDILYGLPKQTPTSFQETINQVLEFSPDRVALIRFNYDPRAHPNQKMINPSELPSLIDNAKMFESSVERLIKSGYQEIGFDYFAKPSDRLSKLWRKGDIDWNMIGYTPNNANKILAIGLGSSSKITNDYYFKNETSLTRYNQKISEGRFPVEKGWKLSRDDKIRRAVTMGIRSKLELKFSDIENKYNVNFNDYFADEVPRLEEFVEEGVIELNGTGIKLTKEGMPFTSFVCMVFDNYLENK